MSTPQPPAGDPYGQGPTDPYSQGPSDPYGQAPYAPGPGVQGGRPRPSVGFGQAVSLFFKNYAVFNGRASRSEFWWVYLFLVLVNIVINGITRLTSGDNGTSAIGLAISGVWSLAILVPGLALAWRRLHDTGRSGGWVFINLIPLIGTIIYIVFTAGASKPDAWQKYDNGKLPVES